MTMARLWCAAGVVVLCCAAVASAVEPTDDAGAAAASTDPLPLPFAVDSGVIELTTAADARRLLRRRDEAAIVFCYDSAETNSYRASRKVAEAANALSGLVAVYGADVRNPQLRWLHDAWTVKLVPTVRGLGAYHKLRASEANSPLAIVGGGKPPREWPPAHPITVQALKAFALKILTDEAVRKVKDDSQIEPLLKAVSAPGRAMPTVILLTNKPGTSQLYMAVSTAFVGRIDFVEVLATHARSAEAAFAASAVPFLMVFDREGAKHVYTGAFAAAAINAFLLPFGGDRQSHFAAAAAAQQEVLDREGIRRSHTVFPVRTQADFETLVTASHSPVGVFFIAPSDLGGVESTVREYVVKNGKKRTAYVQQFVSVDRVKNPALAAAFGVTSDDAQPLVFVTPGGFVPFLGALSPAGLHSFISSKLGRITDAQQYDPSKLPQL